MNRRARRRTFGLWMIVACLATHGAMAGDIFHPVGGRRGMVASRDALASEAGIEVLRSGGNAVDAAVTTAFVLAVTLPSAGNLGGGGFLLLHEAGTGEVHALDYREKAPARATTDLFLDAAGEVDNERSRNSHLASGVPGTVAGLNAALERFGTISLAKALAPAVALAESGFEISSQLASSLNGAAPRLAKREASKAIFVKANGEPWRKGDRFVQTDLAKTLRRIGEQGADEFYRGATAGLIAAEMERHGGLITTGDLGAYEPQFREPVRGTWRDLEIVSMPPPSSGGVHLIQMLNMLEADDLKGSGAGSAATIHLMAEAMRRAYADRSEFLGDPDFVDVPVSTLTSKPYANRLRGEIDIEQATASAVVKPGALLAPESVETTHFCVVDAEGNAVSNTYTLNLAYGSGIVVTGAGFLLNNEMDDFSAKPGEPNAFGLLGGSANAIEPGKRMLSSMTPTIVRRDGEPVLLVGGVGGSRIITATLGVFLNVFEHGMNVQEAVNAPRVHHQWLPDVLSLERGISPDTRRLLEGMGHRTEPFSPARSVTAAIRIFPERGEAGPLPRFEGAADPRRDGVARGY